MRRCESTALRIQLPLYSCQEGADSSRASPCSAPYGMLLGAVVSLLPFDLLDNPGKRYLWIF